MCKIEGAKVAPALRCPGHSCVQTTTFCMYTFHDKLKFESSIFLPITTSEDGNIDKIPIDMR